MIFLINESLLKIDFKDEIFAQFNLNHKKISIQNIERNINKFMD